MIGVWLGLIIKNIDIKRLRTMARTVCKKKQSAKSVSNCLIIVSTICDRNSLIFLQSKQGRGRGWARARDALCEVPFFRTDSIKEASCVIPCLPSQHNVSVAAIQMQIILFLDNLLSELQNGCWKRKVPYFFLRN